MRVAYPTRFLSPVTYLFKPISNNIPLIRRKPHFFLTVPRLQILLTRMAGESESFSTAVASADDGNATYGFKREEMYKSTLAGTVNPYERHLFLCYKDHESWPSQVENSDSDPLPKLFASTLKSRKPDINFQTRLTICEGGDDVKLSDGDLIVFPEMNVYRGLKETDVDSFVEDVLINGKSWMSEVPEMFTGSYVFICAHNNRDRRCGVCGPVLIEKFKEEIESKGLKNQVFVSACSHVGGHKYAGNLIIFSANHEGKIVGNWYGYVTPDDIGELIDRQIGKGEVVDRIWRGQMGAVVKDIGTAEEKKRANGTNVDNNTNQPQEETASIEKIEKITNCCQGSNGISCWRDENAEQTPDRMKLGGLSYWTGKWEQKNVLMTVSTVGALATIAVAYAFYRKAR